MKLTLCESRGRMSHLSSVNVFEFLNVILDYLKGTLQGETDSAIREALRVSGFPASQA